MVGDQTLEFSSKEFHNTRNRNYNAEIKNTERKNLKEKYTMCKRLESVRIL